MSTADVEVDKNLKEVYDEAMISYKNQMNYADISNPQFAARNAEIGAMFLMVALKSATSKSDIIEKRRKRSKSSITNNTTNNVLVTSREELLRLAKEGKI